MIEITDLKDHSIEDIQNLINEEKADLYEIYVPKSTQLFFSERSAIASDYALAAYSGQKLSEISNSFEYEQIQPSIHESICFQITTEDKKRLSEVLLDLTFIYDINSDPEMEDSGADFYQEDVWQFISDIQSGEAMAACPYFIDIVSEFSEEE